MHGIYNYIPETNHVSTVQSAAGVLYLQFVLHVMLFRPWNVFCTFKLVLIIIIIIIFVVVVAHFPYITAI
jgi:O-antigen ligase